MSEHAEDQARAQYESIVELVEAKDYDEMYNNILSVQVRSDWTDPGKKLEPYDYELLLCTGGTAVRLVGTLNEHFEPDTARIEYQDWFVAWTKYHDADEHVLLTFAQQFSFAA